MSGALVQMHDANVRNCSIMFRKSAFLLRISSFTPKREFLDTPRSELTVINQENFTNFL